ncbi:hypothetical protein AVEN_82782-1 [Araneus ventricosus]|uniref:Uncharacterized protein n=1 Tax=Araneus ventricosus TaxID=182803 RepID=A0A4Y2D9X9_ARAVE|nr:hypothetical protein AVEN_82782-1 [Araneus ventricosus]
MILGFLGKGKGNYQFSLGKVGDYPIEKNPHPSIILLSERQVCILYCSSSCSPSFPAEGREGLVLKYRLLDRKAPGSQQDSTEDPPGIGSLARYIIHTG